VVGLAEDGGEDDEVDAVVEEGAEGDGGGLDRRKIWGEMSFLKCILVMGSREWREEGGEW
jgi:hypothetical protein